VTNQLAEQKSYKIEINQLFKIYNKRRCQIVDNNVRKFFRGAR
jgi:hypothetical protein